MRDEKPGGSRAWLRRSAYAAAGAIVLLTGVLVAQAALGSGVAASPMDRAFVDRLSSNGIEVYELASLSGAISPTDAVASPRKAGFGVEGVRGLPTLVSFTDTAYGPADDKGVVSPLYVDVPAWAVTFPGVELPLLGPSDVADGYYKADLVVFLDARTGEYLNAISFGAS